MNKILLTGSMAYDRIMDFPGYFKDQILPDKIHNLNVSFFVQELKESFGGVAGNIAYNLSLLGERSSIFANVGETDFAKYKAWLEKNNIDISSVNVLSDNQTASAYIITDKSDNQIAGFFPGAMLQELDLSKMPESSLAVVSAQNPRDMVSLPQAFKDKKIDYIFDPGQQVSSLSGDDLRQGIKGSKILIGNDYELALIVKKTTWGVAQILENTEILITTLGEKGSRIQKGNLTFDIPAVQPDSIVDPTGAGDAYRAGLIKGLMLGYDLEKSGQLGSVIAAYAIENYGTQTYTFALDDAVERHRQNFS